MASTAPAPVPAPAPSVPIPPPCPPEKITLASEALAALTGAGCDAANWCDTSWCSPCCVWDIPPPPDRSPCCSRSGTLAEQTKDCTDDEGCGCGNPGNGCGNVAYASGWAQVEQADIVSSGQGGGWGQTRHYSNQLTAQDQGANGNSWSVDQLPYITHDGLGTDPNQTTQTVVRDITRSVWFDYSGGNYTARFFVKDTLTRASNYFEYTDGMGRKFKFHDHSTTWVEAKRGRLHSYKDPMGHETVVSYNGSNQASGFVMAAGADSQGYYYDYYTSGENAGKIQYVTQKLNGTTNVHRATYTYYGSSEDYGSLGDLKRVKVEAWDGSTWRDRGSTYYRYYKAGDANGFAHGLKYLVDADGYARLVAGGITPETAVNSYIASVARQYFEYDGSKRVTKQQLHGASQTFQYAYAASGFSNGMNRWKWKTTETLPNGRQNIVYTNHAGQVMLKVFVSGSDKWHEFYEYDSAGRVVLQARSSAITGYNDSYPDLLNKTGGAYQYLHNSAGLIILFEHYTTTDAGTGAVTGRLRYEKVKQGENGTPVTLREYRYATHTYGGTTVNPLWKLTEYRSDASGGSDPVTTEYTYTFHTDSTAIKQKTTTWPTVPDTQHGSGGATSRVEVFDEYGRRTWLKDERGTIFRWQHDNVTGALIQRIDDVDTDEITEMPPSPLAVPSGWSNPNGQHLITDYTSDSAGRPTRELGPTHTIDIAGTPTSIRRARWTVYREDLGEEWTAQGWQKTSDSSYTLVNPVSITRKDYVGRVTDQIQAVRASTSGELAPGNSFAQSTWVRWQKTYYDSNARRTYERVYHNIPSSGEGSAGTNYGQTDFALNNMARIVRQVSPGGTIHWTVYHAKGWVKEKWVGTNDAGASESNPAGSGGANNMKKVASYEYDGNTVGGDGMLTKETRHVNDSTNRETTFTYDYRHRRLTLSAPENRYEAYTPDNLDRVTKVERKNGSGGSLVGRVDTAYDNRGRVWLRTTYSTPTTSNSVTDKTWYDAAGNVIKRQAAGSRAFQKTQYDSLGRAVKTFVCYDLAEDDDEYTKADDVASDTVMSQTENTYDDASNLIRTTHKDRFHNADSTTGELGNPTTQPKARVSYVALYPDAIGRPQASADYGTSGGSAPSWSGTVPGRSDTILVTSTVYDDAGMVWKVTDPKNREDRKEYDDAGRLTKTLENWKSSPSGPDENKETQFTYNADGKMATLVAVNSTTGNQTTTWTYGTTLTESDVASNDLLRYKQYPDGSSSDRVEYKCNRQGEVKEIKDQLGNVRVLEYDGLGRPLHDRVTTLGTGVDSTVRRISRTYESRGNVEKLTSYSSETVGSGTIINEVKYKYNSFGQLEREFQSHGGAVNDTSVPYTPNVQYAYETGGTKNSLRRKQLTYPDATVIDIDYGSNDGAGDVLSVAKQLKNSSTVLVDYTHLGVDRTVIANYSGQPAVELTYYTNGGSGDAGDQYTGIDRFGRVSDQRWHKAGTDRERVKYGFDRAGNRVWRQNTVAGTGQDEYYTYDGLYQIKTLDRGTLTGTFPNFTGISGTPSWEEDWNYDATGNWRGSSTGYLTKVNGSTTLNQNRTHNVANEITDITESTGTAWPTPTHNANGNLTLVPRPLSLGNSFDLKYDAWNRLIEVKESGGSVVATYRYDGASRRVSQDDGTNVRHHYYSDQWQILEERLNSSTTADKRFVWGLRYIDDLILRDSGGTRHYVLHDYFNVTAIVNTSGTVQERYGYDAFGAVRYLNASFGSASSSYTWETLYGAYRYDSNTGLYQVRNRFLHPNLGRWLTRDPIGERGGANLLRYVSNDAINKVDPSGKCPYCGPDVTDWLVNEISRNTVSSIVTEIRTKNGNNNPSAYIQWALMVGPGRPWDHKPIMCTASKRPCPTNPQCRRTVTICGACFDCDVPSNIHYGFVGTAAGFSAEILIAAPGLVQEGSQWPKDDPADSVAIQLGINMAIWEGYPDRLPLLTRNILCRNIAMTSGLRRGPRDCGPCQLSF